MTRFIYAGLILGLTAGTLAVAGYGYLLHYFALPLLLIPLTLSARSLFDKKPLQFLAQFAIIAGFALLGWHLGTAAIRKRALSTCHKLDAYVDQAQLFRLHHGRYPTNLSEMEDFRMPVESIRFLHTAITSDIGLENIWECETTVLLSSNEFACILPVSKLLPLNSTRLYVYRWTSLDTHWKYDHYVR
jgi:hypothetical protein